MKKNHNIKEDGCQNLRLCTPEVFNFVPTYCYFCKSNDPINLEYEYVPELDAYVCEKCFHRARKILKIHSV